MDDYGGWYIKTNGNVPGEWGDGDGYGGGVEDGDLFILGFANLDGWLNGNGYSRQVTEYREG